MTGPKHPIILSVGGEPRSSCCNEQLTVTREVGDTIVYEPTRFTPAADGEEAVLNFRFTGKTYDDPDGTYSVACNKCGAHMDIDGVSLEEQ